MSVLAVLCAARSTRADESTDRQKYYQYMADQRVEVKQDQITFSFNWKQDMGTVFKSGDEFELGVAIDPKYFAMPSSGGDASMSFDFTTNFPCGSRDVYNYTQPTNSQEVYQNIFDGCKGNTWSPAQKKFVDAIAFAYPFGSADSYANFIGLSTCPEMFKKNAPDGGRWKFTYYLKPVPVSVVNNYPEKYECGKIGHNPGWGFFWITAKVQSDTLVSIDGSVKISDCPYLLGLKNYPGALDYFRPYVPNIGTTTPLFNRGCAPTDTIKWGYPDPMGKNWHSSGAAMCRDCDGDGLYDTDFTAPMNGTLAVDCNDSCPNINVCGQGNKCGTSQPSYCSRQCGGNGCGSYNGPCSKNPPTCKGSCVPGETDVQVCTDHSGTSERVCLDSCSWSTWQGCDGTSCKNGDIFSQLCTNGGVGTETWFCNGGTWEKIEDSCILIGGNPGDQCPPGSACTPGDGVTALCPDGVHVDKKICNDQCQWDVISTCPVDPSCGGFCSDGTVCNSMSGQCELDPNMGTGGSGNSGGSNGSGSQNTSDPCGGPCPSGTSCNVTLGVCVNAGTNGSGNGGSANSGGNTGSGGSLPVPCGGFCGPDTYCNPVSNMCEQLNGGSGGSGSSGSGGSSSSGGNTGSGGSSSCSCSSGICCDGCNFLGTSSVCDGYFTYRCEGNGLGQDGQQAVVNTYCSGFSANCNGATTQSSWTQYQDCSPSQQCQMSGSVPVCVAVQPCSDVYLFDGTYACMTNSGKIGAPTICLEVLQQNGSLWQYRACRQGGNFANDFTIRLLDQNHLPHNLGGPYANTKGNACSQWHDFDVSYLNGYGAVNGAGLVAEILSPASCAQSSCTYQTGIITIRRECQ